MKLIDTHAHLYAKEFDQDRDEIIRRAIVAGVTRFYLPNIDSGSIEMMLGLEAAYPEHCFAMMGLHPCSVKENYREELAVVRRWLDRRPFCAVGEIGIDLYWDTTFYEQQKEAFLTQVRWAVEFGMPIVIHSRRSIDVIIELLQAEKGELPGGVFHCFDGNKEQAQVIIDLGFYLGIGGVLTFKKSGLDKVIERVELDRIVLETDSPYLAPSPHRGSRNESAFVRLVAEKLAEIKGMSLEEVAEVTSRNAQALFSKEPVPGKNTTQTKKF